MIRFNHYDKPEGVIECVNKELIRAGVKLQFQQVPEEAGWAALQLVTSDGSPAIPGDILGAEDDCAD